MLAIIEYLFLFVNVQFFAAFCYNGPMHRIILITGAPGSGKSTVARRLAQHFPKSLHLQVDHLREMMVNGVALPGSGWNDEITQQFQWARASAIHMAQVYAHNGVDAVIDDVAVPAAFADHYVGLDAGLDFGLGKSLEVHRVLLLPAVAALLRRLRSRGGPYDQVLVDEVPWFYSYLDLMPKDGWQVLDSGDWTVEQTVQAVLHGIGG